MQREWNSLNLLLNNKLFLHTKQKLPLIKYIANMHDSYIGKQNENRLN